MTEAQYMLEKLSQISEDVVEALEKILPGVMTCIEAQQLLKIGIRGDVSKLRRLKRAMGFNFYPVLGYFTGCFYFIPWII